MADFVLIRPANDAAAIDLSNWGANLRPDVASALHTLAADLYAAATTRSAVDAAFPGTRCVLFFGHGNYAELLGAGNILVDTANIGRISGNIFVAIACSSANVLGPDAVSQGVEAYLGFTDRFAWVSRDPDSQFEPAATAGIRELLAGRTIDDAKLEMESGFQNTVRFYQTGAGRGTPNSTFGWLTAWWDIGHLALIGIKTTTL
jgi:hypothetical protein